MLNKVTLAVIQAFPCQMARIFLGTQAGFAPSSGRGQDIYDAVADFLGEKVYYNTRAVSSTRSDEGVTVLVHNEVTGQQTQILAGKLLIAIQPVATKLAAFDLDEEEASVFGKMQYTRLYSGIGKFTP